MSDVRDTGTLRAQIKPHDHELKTWPQYFSALLDGTKTFEYRRNDRGFKVGDVLWLLEWDPDCRQYTGRGIYRRVSYLLHTDISGDFVVMSLTLLEASPAPASPDAGLVDLARAYPGDDDTEKMEDL